MSQENVELVHQAADAFNRRDLDAYLALADPAVEGRSLLVAVEGDYHGHEGVRRWWRDVFDASPDFTIDIVDVRDLGEVTLTKMRARGHGAGSDVPFEQTLWSAARWREKKTVWSGTFATETEALEAVGLRE
jgi:ketosteroid isomerase-like protein